MCWPCLWDGTLFHKHRNKKNVAGKTIAQVTGTNTLLCHGYLFYSVPLQETLVPHSPGPPALRQKTTLQISVGKGGCCGFFWFGVLCSLQKSLSKARGQGPNNQFRGCVSVCKSFGSDLPPVGHGYSHTCVGLQLQWKLQYMSVRTI